VELLGQGSLEVSLQELTLPAVAELEGQVHTTARGF
jgi:hypothetical protein